MINPEQLLAELSNVPGAVGFEYPVRKLMEEYWKKFPIEYNVDGMGNLVGRFKQSKKENPTILIMAHMDEIGFLTTEITENGYIKVIPLGGWLHHVVWSQKWIIYHNGITIPAISGVDAPHMLSADDIKEKLPLKQTQMFLDTGLTKEALKDLGIRSGLPVIPDVQFSTQRNENRYVGKAFDDRAGLAVIIRLMEKITQNPTLLDNVNVTFAATVQEEVGLRGAKVIYESIKPDIAINLEFGVARDYPCQFAIDDKPVLGEGPTLFIYDHHMLPDASLLEFIHQTAQKNKIPTQWEHEVSYGQDGASLQACGKGIPAINIGIPVRYAHSHYGVMDKIDYDNTVNLLYASLNNINHFPNRKS